MPKIYTVEKAFLSTVSKEDKSPQVVQTKGGEMHKYMVQFEDQPIKGWIGILKKPGNKVSEGDEMYGVIEENNWGKPQFTRMQLPQDGSITLKTSNSAPAASQAPSAPKLASPSSETEDKLDYIISLLENFLDVKDKREAQTGTDESPSDIDDGPVDLSQLDY